LTIGKTHLNLSSLIVLDIDIAISGVYPETAKCPCTLPTKFDIRVSIVPTYYEENAVLRLLVEQGRTFTLKDIGFLEKDYQKANNAIKKPYGMILVCGPTGSGKTTTLYTILKTLNTPEVSIITIEDPIEYSLEGVEQIQVNNQTGLTFANGLRSILRQDPNIVMVGEIRDEETAGIAVNAALTGHLLLSTLHTNDAATTLPRLLDMKIEPFLIASTVNIAIGQRLVRKICPNCKAEKNLSQNEIQSLTDVVPSRLLEMNRERVFYRGQGCKDCANTGYFGRIGIYEVLVISEAVKEAIMKQLNAGEIREIAIKEGMTTMLEDGFNKALNGTTSIEEVLRVMHE
jgi:type II secretory ATPase GspE/PulE/Tfp pilus assembly ATPase PilB-like protein